MHDPATTLYWEFVDQEGGGPSTLSRAEVPGGWLVWCKALSGSAHMAGLTFVPDPDHVWLKPAGDTTSNT